MASRSTSMHRRYVTASQESSAAPRLVGVLLCLAAIFAFMSWRLLPRPLPADAPADRFSAERALELLKALVGNGVPHPVGSAEDARVRTQILAELEKLQIPAETHDGYGCASQHVTSACAPVHNIVARLPGPATGKAVLLVAHHDSQAAAPGAADDGAGVVTLLEVARILNAGPALARPIMFLFDDAEESGLLGAEAFASSDPWMKEVGAVVNLEARGTAGPSRLFETSGPNAWLAQHVGRALPRPNTSSIYTSIYERLPNDTDLTIFRRHGAVPGVNFAFIGDAERYHTPLDNVANLDPRSLQQQGDNALAAARALAAADIEHAAPGRAVFFDVAGFGLISWPDWLTIPLQLLAVVLIFVAIYRNRGRLSRAAVAIRVVMLILLLIVTGVAASVAIRAEIWSGALPSPWVAHPAPAIALMVCLPLATLLGLLWAVDVLIDQGENWSAAWLVWAVLGAVMALALPGGSYLFLLPTLVAGLAALTAPPTEHWFLPTAVPALVAGVLWFPVLQSWYTAMGTPMLAGLAVFTAVLLIPLLPIIGDLPRRRLGTGFRLALIALLPALAGFFIPPHSPESPGPLSFQLRVDGDTHRAKWVAMTWDPELPAAVSQVTSFGAVPLSTILPPLPKGVSLFMADAASSPLEPPDAKVLENAAAAPGTEPMRRVRLHVASRRQAQIIEIIHGIENQPATGSFRVLPSGTPLPYERTGWVTHTLWNVPPEGLDVELTMPAVETQIIVQDVSLGLPPEGQSLLAARPPTFVPIHRGDTAVVSRTLKL